MPKKTTRKNLIKSEDEFLTISARALSFFNSHLRELKIAAIVIAAGCVVFLATTSFYRHINKKGQEAYNHAYSALSEQIKPEMDADKLTNVHDLFAKVVEDHSMSKVADLALPQLAFLKFMDGKSEEAIRLYMDFKEKRSGDKDFLTLSTLAIATSHEANGDVDKAIGLLDPVASDQANRFRETALFTLARLYKLAGREARAAELARDFIEEFQGSPFEPIAKTYL
jgi:outer membrane protein assembly factor BamD (BamD/ComL family)